MTLVIGSNGSNQANVWVNNVSSAVPIASTVVPTNVNLVGIRVRDVVRGVADRVRSYCTSSVLYGPAPYQVRVR
eukprot:SAG31_NODE_429_length_15801_cov_6.878551_9_plen_74_part_00